MSEQNLTRKTTVQEQGFKSELLWLAPALLSSVVLLYIYLQSHPYPSFGAGLYMLISERIIENGYALPKTIPYYTDGGVPFAYPPLMFYVVAVIRDVTGLGPMTISRYLPGLVTVAYLVPLYFLSRDLLKSRPQAALATLIAAVSPPVLRWHISAGGIVRAPAFLLALTGIYAGLRLYRDRDVRWVVPSLGLFTLTVLTHPTYTVFFALSYFLLYLKFDRSLWGLKWGMVVGFGSFVLTAPWWTQVMATHGVDVFTGAAGTHGGIGGGLPTPADIKQLDSSILKSLWYLGPIAGGVYLLRQGRYFLPLWLVAVTVTLGKTRFTALVGALVVSVLVLEGVGTRLKESRPSVTGRGLVTFALVLGATVGLAGGAMYTSGDVNAHAGSPSQPQFVDQEDMEAMTWVEHQTVQDATFVVQGDAAEWFPQQTRRTMLVGPWGVEWKGSGPYNRQLTLYQDVSACNSAQCMSATLSEAGVQPDYIYLPKGKFTVRGMKFQRTSQLAMSMHLSPRYQTVYENEGVIIFETMGDGDDSESGGGGEDGGSQGGDGGSSDGNGSGSA